MNRLRPQNTNTGRRIASYILLAIVPLLVAAGFFLTHSAQRNIEQTYYASADAVSAFVIQGLASEKRNLSHYLNFWTSNPSFELAFESASVFNDTTGMDRRAAQVLQQLNLDRIEIVDLEGNPTTWLRKHSSRTKARSPEVAAAFKAAIHQGESYTGIIRFDGGLWIAAIAPARINGIIAGAVKFSKQIDEQYLQPIRESARANVLMLQGDRVAAANPAEFKRFEPDPAALRRLTLEKKNQYALVKTPSDAYLAVYAPLTGVDNVNATAAIVVLLNARKYQAALHSAATSWIITIGVLSLVVVVVALWVGKTIDGINRVVVAARDYTDNIVQSLANTLLVVQRDHTIQSANRAALDLLGYTHDELIGQPIARVLRQQTSGPSVLDQARERGFLRDVELAYRTKDGRLVPMNFTASALHGENSGAAGLVCVAQDISDCKKAEAELKEAHEQLEERVEERTLELKKANVDLRAEVVFRKEAQQELEVTHRQMLELSRQAGMAEVATGVLHNVGNVLNSVNVSATIIADQLRKPRGASLDKVVALIQEHAAHLGAFIENDAKGKKLPELLKQLAEHLAAERKKALAEVELLKKNIEHIKDIVAMQQSYAKVSGVAEFVKLTDVLEDALRLNAAALQRHGVEIVREFQDSPQMNIDKHKVLQILVNLIRNGKYACDESERTSRRLTIRVTASQDRVRIAVADNGVGIPAENLRRIFNHGFTTRKGGHGFGLHSGALAAREMGGSLTVHSDGLGQGATFTLELPLETDGKKS